MTETSEPPGQPSPQPNPPSPSVPESDEHGTPTMPMIRIDPPDATLPEPTPPDLTPSDPEPPKATLGARPRVLVGEPTRQDVPVRRTAPTSAYAGRADTGRADTTEPDGPAPCVIELRDVGLRGLSPPHARPHRGDGRGRHRRRPVPGQHLAGHQPTPGPGPGKEPGAAAEPGLVNLSVRPGELITLTGPAGSGKSSLLHVIGLVDRPATGRYLLNGRDTARLGDRDRAALRGHQIGLQFQRPHLLPVRTALDNVALPLRYAGLPRLQRTHAALAALDRVGLTARAQVIIAELSAAERKLVTIARALATNSDLVLFDDPTAGLDEGAASRIVSLLVGLHRDGRTVLVATDDQFATAYSSRRIALARHR